VPLGFFSPRPPPSFGWGQKAQTHGDRATNANWRDERGGYRRRLPARPDQSPDACHDCQAGPHRSDRCGNASGSWNSSDTRRSLGGPLDDRWINRPSRVMDAGRMCGERRSRHIAGKGFACGDG
jgi:hypothetical protein